MASASDKSKEAFAGTQFSVSSPAMFKRGSDRYAPGDVLDVAGHRVRLKVDGRARRVSLRVDAARREVIAVAPSVRRLGDAAAFALERAQWIGERAGRLPEALALEPGAVIQVLGRPCLLERAPTRRAQGFVEAFMDGEAARLLAHGEDFLYARSAIRLLKAEALRVLKARSAVHAEALGHPLPSVAVADPRSRWGSCARPRPGRPASLRYSWRLILAPFEVLDYVAAHECAHLVHPDHSPRFWAVVAELVGEAKAERAWLRAHGPTLHAVGP